MQPDVAIPPEEEAVVAVPVEEPAPKKPPASWAAAAAQPAKGRPPNTGQRLRASQSKVPLTSANSKNRNRRSSGDKPITFNRQSKNEQNQYNNDDRRNRQRWGNKSGRPRQGSDVVDNGCGIFIKWREGC